MLVSNPFKPDPRVYEEAKALINAGYDVTIIAWDRECRFPAEEKYGKIDVKRISVPGGYAKFSEFFPGLLRFYRKVIQLAHKMDFDAVHAHDFDTLPLGILIARRKNVPIIYDVHDDYPSMISESVPNIVTRGIEIVQSTLVRFADGIIYANEALKKLIKRDGTVVMNCKDPAEYRAIDDKAVELKNKLGIRGFTIVYIGILRQYEFLMDLITAVEKTGTWLVIGGDGPLRDKILKRIENSSKIKYVGWVQRDNIPVYTKMADAIVILNNPQKRYDRISTPVKMFEAMAAGVPVIVAKGGEAEKIVLECDCGLAVEYGNVDALIEAINRMKDEDLRKRFSSNALQCAIKKYNRNNQNQNLVSFYESVMNKVK